MNAEDILKRLMRLRDLPTLPQVMTRILATVADENASAQDLAEMVESDHAISARVLRLANSPFYALPRGVDSIHRAIVVVGFDSVKNLALATSVLEVLGGVPQFAFDPQDFWMHSLGAASATKLLAQRMTLDSSVESCFTAGLLHDVGKYALGLLLKDTYRDLVARSLTDGRPLNELESEALGLTHSDAGRWLAEKWCFPDMIAAAIGYMYRVPSYKGSFAAEVSCVRMGDLLSSSTGYGTASELESPQQLEDLGGLLGIDENELDEVRQVLRDGVDRTRSFLDSILRPEGDSKGRGTEDHG